MSNGHKTSAVPRPAAARGQKRPDADHTRLSDFTRPIPEERRLVTRRLNRWVLAFAAFGIVGALLAALFVLPVQAWLQQEDTLTVKRSELEVLTNANAELAAEVNRLKTPEGAKEAARDELGLVEQGEIRISVLPGDSAPLTLPAGWPYDAVTQIIAVRAAPPVPADSAPAVAVPTTVAP
jgi:cell division protein FtsB